MVTLDFLMAPEVYESSGCFSCFLLYCYFIFQKSCFFYFLTFLALLRYNMRFVAQLHLGKSNTH